MYNFSKFIASISMLMISCSGGHGQEGETGGSGGYIVSNSGGSSSDSGALGGGTSCAQQQVPIKALPPDILIVQDRSLSMNDDSNNQKCNGGCGMNSKWSQVTTAISTIATSTQNSVNWGLFYFSDGISMCGVNTQPAVPVTSGSASQIISSLSANSPSGATPTSATINNAISYMKGLADPNPKYLLLATDGEPNCLNGSANNKDIQGAITAIGNANSSGYPVFVVGIGNVSTATDTLNSMAQAGGMAQVGATYYYSVTDTSSLEDTLNKIVGMVASCTISLQNVPSGDWTIAIWATDSSGKEIQIQNNSADGWEYTNNSRSSITLVGSSCDSLKNGTYSNLQFVYTCQGQQILPPIG